MEARAGIEPANRGFAVPGLTTWLPRRTPKPLISIDSTPVEQAKSPFTNPRHEIQAPTSFTPFLHSSTQLGRQAAQRHHCDGRRHGLVGHRLLWKRDRNPQPGPSVQERVALHPVLQHRPMLPDPGQFAHRNLPPSGGNRTHDERPEPTRIQR